MCDHSPSFIQETLMREMRLVHYPVGIVYCFTQEEAQAFVKGRACHKPVKPLTFCQAELGPRMEGIRVLVEPAKLGCANAKYVFGWKGFDESEIASHKKYASQALSEEDIVRGKVTLQGRGLVAVGLEPLGLAEKLPDVVHFCCDAIQAYHLAADWMASQGTHPLHAVITANSAACGGNVRVYESGGANVFLACSGNFNSGKMERGEVNFSLPGKHLLALVERVLKRKADTGGASITRLGDPFPGADICKNCPLISFVEIRS